MQRETEALLSKYGLRPNRALGQNFLVDAAALARIQDAAELDGLSVLEIGPGLGALTEGLLSRGCRVVAVEIDAAMVHVLRDRFAGETALTLLHTDFLKADLAEIHRLLGHEPFHVAANLPYYATTPICMRLLCANLLIPSMTLMLQKEAALRFTAGPGARVYGPLSVLSQAYYSVESLLCLSPESFYPRPEVDSMVLRLTRNGQAFLPGLPRLLEAAFAMRRKTLQNNFKAAGLPLRALADCGLSPAMRAEALSISDFLNLCEKLET